MMNKNICLVMQGNANWIGGTEYISNLILAIYLYKKKECLDFKLYLVVSKRADNETIAYLKKFTEQVFFEEDELPLNTFFNRSVGYLRRVLLRDPYPRWRNFLYRNSIDCIYPLNALTPKLTRIQTISWIFDFQHKYYPQFFKPWEVVARDNYFIKIAKNAQKIVVSSKTAQSDFEKFLPWARKKTHILSFYSSCQDFWYQNDPKQIQKKYFLPDRFFLISNQFWQHKNHLLLFEALNLLKENGCTPVVVCTGQLYDDRVPTYCNRILQVINEFGLHEQVYLLGLIPKSDQIALMRRSLAIIQPSLFEGWSTIVENARALGKTIILSDLPVHFEQNAPFSYFFKKNDAKDLANVIKTQWESMHPGPDILKEESAKNENKKLIIEFGKQFVSIVNRCE